MRFTAILASSYPQRRAEQGEHSARQKSYNAQLTASGIRLDQLQAVKAKNIDVSGVVSIQAQGAGTFDNPQLDATLQIPQVDIQNQKVAQVN